MKDGFTLLETVFVISVIGIVISIIMPVVNRIKNDVRYKVTMEEMENIVYAIVGNLEIKEKGKVSSHNYFSDTGSLPTTLNNLITNPGVSGWNGPYLRDVGDFKDGWGNDYIYDNLNGYIRSKGPDGINGTSDDLTKYIYQPIGNLTNNSIRVYVYDSEGNTMTNSYLKVQIKYPFSSNYTDLTYSNGYFYLNSVPYGLSHKIRISLYDSTISDTIEEYICVYPNGPNFIQKFVLKLKGAIGEEI
jgi:prepilin-type N-terminal cleavage/methylation domain-containing protein